MLLRCKPRLTNDRRIQSLNGGASQRVRQPEAENNIGPCHARLAPDFRRNRQI
jgi:hypothetical protein